MRLGTSIFHKSLLTCQFHSFEVLAEVQILSHLDVRLRTGVVHKFSSMCQSVPQILEQFSEDFFQQDDDVFVPQDAANTPAPVILQDSTDVVTVPTSQCIVDVAEPQDFQDVAVRSLQEICKTKERDKRVHSTCDIVFFDERPKPCMVYLVGYGGYKDQIRVVRFFKNHHKKTNERWECTRCYRLEVGDALLCTDHVTAIAPDSFCIHRGSHCVFHGWIPIGIWIPVAVCDCGLEWR